MSQNSGKGISDHSTGNHAPTWFRYAIVAMATLTLCSCQATLPTGERSGALVEQPQLHPSGLEYAEMISVSQPRREVMPTIYQTSTYDPPPAKYVAQYQAGIRPEGCQSCAGCSSHNNIVGPRDEYLCDGGDFGTPAGVTHDWEIVGLEQEDTVAHYDTVDGRTLVTPSNRVCVYSPRFAAVRRTIDLQEYARYDAALGYEQAQNPVKIDEREGTTTTLAKQDPTIHRGENPPSLMLERQKPGELGRQVRLAAEIGTLSAHADLQVVRTGTLISDERVKLARSALAAVTWAGDQAVQVIIDSQDAVAVQDSKEVGQVYHLDQPNKPVLRLLKLASTGAAKPGDVVEFTFRLDNIGNREMGNVTVADNLTTRLEYIPGSATSSVEADFIATPNEGGSEILRWEIIEPLAAGEGVIITFKCRVR